MIEHMLGACAMVQLSPKVIYPESDGKPMADNKERQRADRLATKLRELGLDPDQI